MALQQQASSCEGVSAELALKKAAAASGGALLTSLFTTPLDVAKVRLQSQIATRSFAPPRPSAVVTSSSPMSMISATMEQCRCKGRCPCNRVMTRSVDQLGYRPGVLSCMRMSCSRSVTAAPLTAQTQIPKQPHIKLSGTGHALRHIFQTEGVAGLFSGLSPTMMIAVPSTVLYYISYDLLLQKGREQIPEHDAIVPLLAGTTARVVAASVTSPIELIRTRMQGNPSAGGILRTFHHAIRSGGYQSLLNGLVATLARDVPFSAIYWTSYESLQQKCANMEAELSLSRTQRAFACGAMSGAIAATLTTPFDVVKTLQQVKIPMASMGPNPSGVAVLKQIVATQGMRGAFTGLSARLARVTPSCAIMISCYELGKEKLGLP
ncbi:hypothetical protein Gpo141_00009016 [Globisporangium polare]